MPVKSKQGNNLVTITDRPVLSSLFPLPFLQKLGDFGFSFSHYRIHKHFLTVCIFLTFMFHRRKCQGGVSLYLYPGILRFIAVLSATIFICMHPFKIAHFCQMSVKVESLTVEDLPVSLCLNFSLSESM